MNTEKLNGLGGERFVGLILYCILFRFLYIFVEFRGVYRYILLLIFLITLIQKTLKVGRLIIIIMTERKP